MHHWFNVTKNGSTKQKCKGSTLPPCATPVWIGTPVDLWLFAPSQERQGSGTTAWIWWTTRRAGKRMIYNNKQILFQCAELSSWQRIVKMLRIGQIKHDTCICCKCIQFWGINLIHWGLKKISLTTFLNTLFWMKYVYFHSYITEIYF